MGLMGNLAAGAIGYGLHALKTRNDNNSYEKEIEAIRAVSLREWIDKYRNANGIALGTLDIEHLIDELKEIAHDYELGI